MRLMEEMMRTIRTTARPMLTPDEVGIILGVNPQSIRNQARIIPNTLGFPVVVVGNRVLIPRKPFLKFIGEKEENANETVQSL